MSKPQFINKIAFGAWINDIKNEAMIEKNWPYVEIDEKTMEDYIAILDLQKEAGFDAFDVFGLLVGHDWPTDISSVLKNGRRELVEKMIELAHDKGIKIIYGLGVFSWGFDKIIESDPEVKGTNPSAMCGSKLKSQKWQENVVDLVATNFNIDGFHLEASDQGRCSCPSCIKENNVEYYSRLNAQVAVYIRSKWPDKILLVNDCAYLPWGDFIQKDDFKYVYELSDCIDIFIDNGNHGFFIREEDRRELISNLHCRFGTAGGFWVYPPQRWDRLRWFLPYVNRTGDYLKSLYEDGGRACEYYMGPTANPGTEVNILSGGLLLSDIKRDNKNILVEVIDRLYKPKTESASNDLVEIFIHAENAFFNNWSPCVEPFELPEEYAKDVETLMTWSVNTPERTVPGELFLESLVGKNPGDPIYITNNMKSEGRANYKKELNCILDNLHKIGNEYDDGGRIKKIEICIKNVIQDLEMIQNNNR
jgi:hypothetical protein